MIFENGEPLKETAPFEKSAAITEADVDYISFIKQKEFSVYEKDEGYAKITFSIPCEDTVITRDFAKTPLVYENKEELASIIRTQAEGLKQRLVAANAKKAVILVFRH